MYVCRPDNWLVCDFVLSDWFVHSFSFDMPFISPSATAMLYISFFLRDNYRKVDETTVQVNPERQQYTQKEEEIMQGSMSLKVGKKNQGLK